MTDAPALRTPDSAEAVLANVRALLPLVAAESDAVDAAARLTPALERAFRAAGILQMAFPAFRGGLEMTLSQQLEVVAEIATVDASAGWNVAVLNAGGYYAARLGDRAYAELYPTRDRPTSGSFHPRGRARRVEGGYLVTGRWDWGSGSLSADHVVGSAEVYDGEDPVLAADGRPLHLGLWLPREAIRVLDNWQVLGVRGSGSTSYEITEPAFVPEHHSFDRDAAYDQGRDPLNRSVRVAHFPLTGVALGVARRLVHEAAAVLAARTAGRSARSLDGGVLRDLGTAMTEVDFAFAGVRDVARITDEILFGDLELTPVHEARMTAANAAAGNTLRRVVELATEVAGASYLRDTSPMQRVLRDAHGALAHTGTRRMLLGALAAEALDAPSAGLTVPDDARHGSGALGVLEALAPTGAR
ncbi:acyl-CoA dehydrogenase family protein [Nocardioides sp. zg-DK7169]|uniref:acyl-CoA dehydrogenase family protein n=1 Tax=Nocardioides sp. zg-DK7169 TaxID=2736600 RepID=UPI001C12D746